ncbi:hypothetical protein ACVWY3_006974 [Bradyrhizobium sp. USDA 4486]
MSVGERSARKSLVQIPVLSDNMLLAIIAVGFCVLHILTAVFLMPPSGTAAAPPEKSLALYD